MNTISENSNNNKKMKEKKRGRRHIMTCFVQQPILSSLSSIPAEIRIAVCYTAFLSLILCLSTCQDVEIELKCCRKKPGCELWLCNVATLYISFTFKWIQTAYSIRKINRHFLDLASVLHSPLFSVCLSSFHLPVLLCFHFPLHCTSS